MCTHFVIVGGFGVKLLLNDLRAKMTNCNCILKMANDENLPSFMRTHIVESDNFNGFANGEQCSIGIDEAGRGNFFKVKIR